MICLTTLTDFKHFDFNSNREDEIIYHLGDNAAGHILLSREINFRSTITRFQTLTSKSQPHLYLAVKNSLFKTYLNKLKVNFSLNVHQLSNVDVKMLA